MFFGIALVVATWALSAVAVFGPAAGVALGIGEPRLQLHGARWWASAAIEGGIGGGWAAPVVGAAVCGVYGIGVARPSPRLRPFGLLVGVAGALGVGLRFFAMVFAMGLLIG